MKTLGDLSESELVTMRASAENRAQTLETEKSYFEMVTHSLTRAKLLKKAGIEYCREAIQAFGFQIQSAREEAYVYDFLLRKQSC